MINLKTEKEPRYPVNKKLFVPQTQSIRYEKKNVFHLPEFEPQAVHPVVSPLPNTLSRLSLLLSVSRSYLLLTTHTPAQRSHNHTPHPVLRGSLNAELSTTLQDGLPCRSPCAHCRPLYSEEYRDNAGLLGMSTVGVPVSTAMQLQAVQPVFTDRCFLTVLDIHPLLVFRTEHKQSGSWISFRPQTKR